MVIPDPDTSIADLMDYISAAQMAEPTSDHREREIKKLFHELPLEGRGPPDVKKKKLVKQEFHRGREIRAWRSSRKEEMEKRKRYLSPVEDDFIKFNCLLTCYGSALETERIRKDLEGWQGDPPEHIQKRVLNKCRKWNFVWTAKNSVAPLLPEEVELMLGYPRNHTRGGGTSQAERYKSLGNSFQVNTVAFHLSVLKNRYPNGISVLSLFSGIGGAEIALHQLGIPLRFVVAVEISEVSRNIFRGWWENTDQKGILIDNINDVTMLTADKIEKLVDYSGGFDLVIGGSPCNNLTGSNRWHRDGLDGKQSVLFYDYCRILNTVKRLMREN
ncbi:hypothetical protein MKW92_010403 [Papaver armeniacum]|nr:hypothetical protein MKW92_010403 [Papaver armeniacum]